MINSCIFAFLLIIWCITYLTSAISFNDFLGPTTMRFGILFHNVKEDMRYRKSSLEQYRDQLTSKLTSSFDQFKKDQLKLSSDASNDFEIYLSQFKQIYNDTISSLQLQKNAIQQLKTFKIIRPSQIDESLEKFRTFYDENIVKKQMKQFPLLLDELLPPSSTKISLPLHPQVIKSTTTKTQKELIKLKKLLKSRYMKHTSKPIFKDTSETTKELTKTTKDISDNISDKMNAYFKLNKLSFSNQLENLNRNLISQWRTLTLTLLDHQSIITESSIQSFLTEFQHIQNDIIHKADQLLLQSQNSINKSLNKKDILNEKIDFDTKFEELEETAQIWIDKKINTLDQQLKLLQEKLLNTNKLYEELLNKKRSELVYTTMNDETLHKVLSLIDPKNFGWKFISKSDVGDIQVFRRFLPGPSSQYACVMCNGTINSSPYKVLSLLEDPNRIKEYNSFYVEGN